HPIVLNDNIIRLLSDSLAFAPLSRENTRKYIESMARFIKKNNNSRQAYISIIDACVALGDLKLAQHIYTEFKAAVLLKKCTIAFEASTLSSSNKGDGFVKEGLVVHKEEKLRKFTPRRTIASMLRLMSCVQAPDLRDAVRFFENEVLLDEERVQTHWKEIENGWKGVQKSELVKAQEASKRSRVKILDSRVNELMNVMQSGVPVRVGFDGPFAVCYKAIDVGFRIGLEQKIAKKGIEDGIGSGIDRGRNLMHLAAFIEKLQEIERKTVLKILNRSE
ncbi:hypothetical protein HK100_006406, partial [Physocladia obscura]